LRERWSLSETYLSKNLTVLREFLRWAGNSLANEPQEWSHAKPVATHRRWLTVDQLSALMRAARGRERVLVAPEGYNELRRIEVLRLHARDLSFALPPTMRVLERGRFGGKPRIIPMSATAHLVLVESAKGLRQEALVYPDHRKTADRDLLSVAKRAKLGVRVSGHDLRRSFGRIAYRNGCRLVDLRNLLGRETLDMTIHYVRVDTDEMAAGLDRFEQAMRESLTVPRQ
jgi:integrase